jgi:hypothetical protein
VLKTTTEKYSAPVKFRNECSEWRSETIEDQLPIQESVIYYQSILAIRFRHQESRAVRFHPFNQQFLDHFPHLLESWWDTLALCVIAQGSAQINQHQPPLSSPFQAYLKTISENPLRVRLASLYAGGREWNRVQPTYGTAPSHTVFMTEIRASNGDVINDLKAKTYCIWILRSKNRLCGTANISRTVQLSVTSN